MRSRFAVEDDIDVLLDMMDDFNQGEGIDVRREALEPSLRKLLGDEGLGRVTLAEVGGAVVGYAVVTWGYDLEFAGRDAYLTELYLRPEQRGRGLGKRLLAEVEAVARGSGARALHLGVRTENSSALGLYRGAGYAPWTRILMTKML
jgi:ribosomal protein S18 acetylase RimI-like enzyme